MFSQQRKTAPTPGFSLGLPLGDQLGGSDQKKAKPLTPAEKYQQALVTANVFVEDSRVRVQWELDKYSAVANNNYWFYGYFAANAAAAMGGCLVIGNRVPFFRAYSGWIAVAAGYFGSKTCMAVHGQYLLAGVIKQVDHEISEAKRLDEQTNNLVPEYKREAERLTTVKYELMPTLPEAMAARANQKELSMDERVNSLVDAYNKRKEALQKK